MLKYFYELCKQHYRKEARMQCMVQEYVKWLFLVVIARPVYMYACMSHYFSSGVDVKEISPSSGHTASAGYPINEYTFWKVSK